LKADPGERAAAAPSAFLSSLPKKIFLDLISALNIMVFHGKNPCEKEQMQ
jgi:hypothetical protein